MLVPKKFFREALFDLVVALIQDYQYAAPFDMRAIANAKSLHHALTLCGWSCWLTPSGDLAIEEFPEGLGYFGLRVVDLNISNYLSPYLAAVSYTHLTLPTILLV